jgi:two-component system cell cycle response regulator CtrA
MTRALLVEDEASTALSVQLALAAHAMVCDTTDCGREAIQMAKRFDYDIMIIDLKLPDMNGMDLLLSLRSAKVRVPVLILSGLTETEHKIKGLGSGADDYLTKPFNRGELIARVQAIVRRSRGHSESIIRFGDVAVNLDTRTVEVNGTPLHLTSKEYAILELLAMRKGTVLTKEMFLNHLYGGIDEPELKIIDVFVCKLRKKLSEASGGVNHIQTVWGRGYMLQDLSQSDEDNYDLTLTPSRAEVIES